MGIRLAFIATRSGFMRYADHSHLFYDPTADEEKNKMVRRKPKKQGEKKKKEEEEEKIKEP